MTETDNDNDASTTSIDDSAFAATLVDQILEKAHPLLEEALYLAAVPHVFNVPLLKAMRARDDDRDERLVNRLHKFSFITQLADADGGEPRYHLTPAVRKMLQQHWIKKDPEAYVTAHRRVLDYLDEYPDPDPYLQESNRIYHLLFVDGEAGYENLQSTFSKYLTERRLAEVERVLGTAVEARSLLAVLETPTLGFLDHEVNYGYARLAQVRGKWAESLQMLTSLRDDPDLLPTLRPFVVRACGISLERIGQHVEAIEQYQAALEAFSAQPDTEAEQAFTMIRLGDAHVNLAVSARGYRELLSPKTGRLQRLLRDVLFFPASLPLLLYIRSHFGRRIFNPATWRLLRGQDWIVARLFGVGARWYRRAGVRLRSIGASADVMQVLEKQADLHLTLGDSERAVPLLRELLEQDEAPLSEYREARIGALLGQALLRLGRPQDAVEQLQAALPVIQAYEDAEVEARVIGLLAESYLEVDQVEQALRHFDRALRLHQRLGDTVGATEIVERLGVLRVDERLSAEERKHTTATAQMLSRREYLVQIHHPVLVTFRRVALLLLAAFIFFIPLTTITVESGNVTLDRIGIQPSPPLQASLQPLLFDVAPSFNTGFFTTFDAGLAARVGVQLLAAYMVIYLVIGVVVISQTDLRTVQERTRSAAVQVDMKELAVGRGEDVRSMPWKEGAYLYTADIELFGGPMPENSAFVVASPSERITVTGNTAWYTALRDRAIRYLPGSIQTKRLGYRILRSKLGIWYVLSLLALFVFGAVGQLAPDKLGVDLLGTVYSAADIYPLLYLGLVVPPLFWAVLWPLRIQAYTRPNSRLVWIAFGAALLLAVDYLEFTVGSRAEWVLPQTVASREIAYVYPALAIIVLLAGVTAFVWTAREAAGQNANPAPVQPLWVRALVTAVSLALIVVTSRPLARHVHAYHLLVVGNAQRDAGIAALADEDEALSKVMLRRAVETYDRSLALAPRQLGVISSRAAVQIQLMQYDEALAGFDQAIQIDPDNDAYLWRGVTYHAQRQLDLALADYEWILARDPTDVKALTARGWVYFQRGNELADQAGETEDEAAQAALIEDSKENYRLALESFQAAERQESSADVWLAIGYVHYQLGEYKEAELAWNDALTLDRTQPVIFVAHATAHWRLATVDDFACSKPDATDEEKIAAAAQIDFAISEMDRALALEPDSDFTYRTRGQLEYLLRVCPGYDFATQVSKAIASYGEALRYAPDNDLYLQFRARIGFVLSRYIFLNEPENQAEARAVLDTAIEDIERAYAIDPDGPDPRPEGEASNEIWRDFIVGEAWGLFHYSRGWNYYQDGEYELALADAVAAAKLLPENAMAAFNAGLFSLALDNAERAVGWYDDGVERAVAAGDAVGLQEGLDDLRALLEARPELEALAGSIVERLELALSELEVESG